MARQSHAIFLTKETLQNFEDYLTERARNQIGTANHQLISINNLGDGAELHTFRGSSGPPQWMRRLSQRFPELNPVNRQSVAGLLFVHTNARVLVLSYSYGWMLLDESMLEADFGLLVAINSLNPEKLKRLERSNLGDAIQGISQSPFQRDFTSFGIDDALDLVKKLSGSANEESGLDTVSGSRSLKVTGDISIDEIIGMSEDILALFASTAYRDTAFRIIDAVRPVTDTIRRNSLFESAAASIRAGEDRFELCLPSTLEAEPVSFRFAGPGLRRSFPDLLLQHYVSAMGTNLANVTSHTLEDHKIISDFDEDRPPLTWSIRKALLGSITLGDERYAINDGQWYRIDDGFRISIESSFNGVVREWDVQRPSPIIKFYDVDNNGSIETELAYNARIAEELGLILLDTTEIAIPNVVRSGFEPCDLLDVANRRFIHVKKSSRRSSILSHFFKQGSNSGQQFRKVPATWNRLAELVRNAGHAAEANILETHVDNPAEVWTIEYWIADAPRADGSFNIPFFSKITLHDEVKDLRAMQYDVALRFIAVPPDPL